MINKYILVLDDEAGRKSIRKALKNLRDVEIFEADNVPKALELLSSYPIRLIITDILIEASNGMDLISTIRKNGVDTSVIFTSDEADKTLAIKALRLQAFDFIEKPFHNDVISTAVEKALASKSSEFLPKLENLNLNLTQIRVLEMIMKGLSNKEIADVVNLSEQGVKYHVGNLFKRFESSSRSTLRSKIWELISV